MVDSSLNQKLFLCYLWYTDIRFDKLLAFLIIGMGGVMNYVFILDHLFINT